jgi:hypothetical protein
MGVRKVEGEDRSQAHASPACLTELKRAHNCDGPCTLKDLHNVHSYEECLRT